MKMLFKTAHTLFLLPFLTLVIGAPDAAHKPKPSATPTPPPKPPPSSSCSSELLCCLEATSCTSTNAESLLGIMHIELTEAQKIEEVGLSCNALSKRGLGESCFEKPMCCDKVYDSGIIAIGCNGVSI